MKITLLDRDLDISPGYIYHIFFDAVYLYATNFESEYSITWYAEVSNVSVKVISFNSDKHRTLFLLNGNFESALPSR